MMLLVLLRTDATGNTLETIAVIVVFLAVILHSRYNQDKIKIQV